MKRRENTFCIDYSAVPKKPSYEELHLFIGTQLGLKRDEVQRIQCSRSTGCAFVKVYDLELAQKIVADHDNKHDVEVEGQRYSLRLRMEDGAVAVRLYDLTEGTTREQIIEYLSAYGDIISAEPEKWDDRYTFSGIESGVWIVKMMVTRNIPSYITIDGDTTYVAYFGQRQTCRHCGEYVHNGTSCVQNKKLLMQKLAVDPAAKPTYANVTKTSAATFTNTRKPASAGPTMVLRSATKPKETTIFNHAKQHSDVNVSATVVAPATSGSNTTTALQSTTAPTKIFRMPRLPSISGDKGQKISKGNDEDTDDSTTSTCSRRSQGRPPGKKQKHGNGSEAMVEDDAL